jgi:hypothetical protein
LEELVKLIRTRFDELHQLLCIPSDTFPTPQDARVNEIMNEVIAVVQALPLAERDELERMLLADGFGMKTKRG